MTLITIYSKYSAKITIIIIICICVYNLYFYLTYSELDKRDNINKRLHLEKVESFYAFRVLRVHSKLGGILFNRDTIPHSNHNQNKTFVVLIWRHWEWLKQRHVYSYDSKRENVDLLADCSVKNCNFSGDNNLINTADAVVVHVMRGFMPSVENRNPKQRWIFLNDEAPPNAFWMAKKKKKKWTDKEFQNVFNWSMTYRTAADIPVPYGRTLPLNEPFEDTEISSLIPNWKNKTRDVPASVLMSHCGVKSREKFLKQLREHINVDVYGKCSDRKEFKKSCPGHFRSDCKRISRYLFYLVLENANCFQYLTEKVFYHAYAKGAIPVIWGPSYEDLVTLLPPNSFLYADEHTDVKDLAKDILAIVKNDDLLFKMHAWRINFKVVNEHGYFGTKSYHLCRICEALNYNDEEKKIYDKAGLKLFFDPSLNCKQ